MNFRTTLLILVLLILAAAAVVYLQQPSDTPPRATSERAAGRGEPVFAASPAFTADAVTHVTVAYPSGRSATAALQEGTWWQTSPTRFELLPNHVRGIIEATVNLHWVERFAPSPPDAPPSPDPLPPSLEQVNLTPPRAVLTIAYTDHAGSEREHVIRLGRAIGGRAYAQVDDDRRVHVVSADLVNHLLPEKLAAPLLSEWRIRTLDGPDAAAARRMLLRNGRQLTELIRAEGKWSFAAPYADRADPQAVSRLLGQLSSIHISQFIADDPLDAAVYGLTEPAIELVVETAVPSTTQWDADADGGNADGRGADATQAGAATPALTVRQSTLRIGGPVDLEQTAFYAAYQDHHHDGRGVFTLSAATVESLRLSADDLRDPRLTPLAAADVVAIRIQRAGEPDLALEREPDGWRLTDQPDTSLSDAAVARLLAAITDTRAVGFLAPDALGPEPVTHITLTAVGQDQPEQLHVHAIADRGDNETELGRRKLVVRDPERLGRVVEAAALDPLFAPVEDLYAPRDASTVSDQPDQPDQPPPPDK